MIYANPIVDNSILDWNDATSFQHERAFDPMIKHFRDNIDTNQQDPKAYWSVSSAG